MVEIAVFTSSVLQCDLSVECCSEAKQRSPFNLGCNHFRIHRNSAVNRANDPMHSDCAVGADFDLGNLRKVATKGELHRYAPTPARWQRGAPIRFFRSEVQHSEKPRIRDQCFAVAQWIL